MKCSKIRKNVEKVTSVLDRLESGNPLLVRKKFQMKDVLFRRDQPEVELFRCEIAWDAELYVLLFVLAAAGVLLLLKTVSCCRRAERRLGQLASRKKKD